MSARLEVPLPLRKRPWLSSNDRDHWGRRKGLTEYYRHTACQIAKDLDVPTFEMVALDVALAFGDNRRRDAHNYLPTVKAIIDGLVDAGVLYDDSDRYVVSTTIRRDETCPKGVSLVIEGVANAADDGHGKQAGTGGRRDCGPDQDGDGRGQAV